MARLGKKGQAEAQFNWIFVLIAGAVILVVAFSFIVRQRNARDLENADKMLKILDEITTGAGIQEGTAEIIDLPNIDVSLSCTEECTCTINVPPAPSSEFASKFIFGPRDIERRIMLWAQSWSMPFRVANFVFATSPNVKYYVVRDPSSAVGRYIEQKLPEFSQEFEISFIDSKEAMRAVKHPGVETVRIVYVDEDTDCTETHQSFHREMYSCLVLFEGGSHVFYEKVSARQLEFRFDATPALGEAALFAAMFSEDYQLYKCNMHKAFARLEQVAEVLQERTQRLEDERSSDPFLCSTYSYDEAGGESAIDALIGIQDAAEQLKYTLDSTHFSTLQGDVGLLERQNRYADDEGCPTMY